MIAHQAQKHWIGKMAYSGHNESNISRNLFFVERETCNMFNTREMENRKEERSSIGTSHLHIELNGYILPETWILRFLADVEPNMYTISLNFYFHSLIWCCLASSHITKAKLGWTWTSFGWESIRKSQRCIQDWQMEKTTTTISWKKTVSNYFAENSTSLSW